MCTLGNAILEVYVLRNIIVTAKYVIRGYVNANERHDKSGQIMMVTDARQAKSFFSLSFSPSPLSLPLRMIKEVLAMLYCHEQIFNMDFTRQTVAKRRLI